MTLKEKILAELREQDADAKAKIEEYEATIRAEAFAMSTVTGGALASTARSACQSRMDAASAAKGRIRAENAWVSEMLEKYG